MAIKILFITFILMFLASTTLFIWGALMLGVDVGTILALVCMIGTFVGMTSLEKIVTESYYQYKLLQVLKMQRRGR
jgi:uncharacterized membrane protein